MNYDSRLWRKTAQQLQQLDASQRDTSGGRGKAFPGDMDKHGAAAAGHARSGIVVDFDDQVVETVVPPEPVAWFIGRPAEEAIIASIRGVLAPGVVAPYPTNGEQGRWPRQPIGPPP